MQYNVVLKILYYTMRVLHIFLNNVMAIPAYLLWCVLLTPLRKLKPKLFWQIENILFKALLSFVVMWANSGGYKLIESGDDLATLHDRHVLLLVNHQSTADVLCVMSALLPKSQVLGQIMWIMDYIFIYTNFGWVSYFHGDFFIQQGKDYKDEQLRLLQAHLKHRYLTSYKKWIALFPEGGFLYKRRPGSQRYAVKVNQPVLTHVALPRLGAVNTILNTLGSTKCENGVKENKKDHGCIEWVVDMTLAYPNSEPLSMPGICVGWWEPRNMMVHYRAYPVSDIPIPPMERTKWLYDRYIEKEQLLEQLYKHGVDFDETDRQCRQLSRIQRHEVPFDKVKFLISYVFYAISAYLFLIYIYIPLWFLVKCICVQFYHTFGSLFE